MAISTEDCDIFIRVLVDEMTVMPGTGNGIYMVDNTMPAGGAGEGGAGLVTRAGRGEKICWKVELVDPNSTGIVTITDVGNAGAWGSTGQPEPASDDPNSYAGVAETAGSFSYHFAINVMKSTGEPVSLQIQPGISVS